MIPNLG